MNHRSQLLSAVVITHNNGATLLRCLESLTWVDELVVLDLGSTDGSLAMIQRFKGKVKFHPSRDPYVLHEQALAYCTKDWVLMIRPDEWVEEMLRHEIDGVLMNASDKNGFMVPIHPQWRGQWLTIPALMRQELRLFRRKIARASQQYQQWGYQVDTPIGLLDRPIGWGLSDSLESLSDRLEKDALIQAYQMLEEQGHTGAKSPLDHWLQASPLGMWLTPLRDYIMTKGWTLGPAERPVASIHGYQRLLQSEKYQELCRQNQGLIQ